jgi:hypothetical protein
MLNKEYIIISYVGEGPDLTEQSAWIGFNFMSLPHTVTGCLHSEIDDRDSKSGGKTCHP